MFLFNKVRFLSLMLLLEENLLLFEVNYAHFSEKEHDLFVRLS